MKRISTVKAIAVTMAVAMTAIMSTACLSVTETGSTTSGTLATTAEVDNRETTEETTTTAKKVSQSEFDIKEYKYENSIGDTYYFLVVKNNSTQAVGVSVNLVAYDMSNNTIGAGDAFASGFLMGFLENAPVKRCIHYGLACAKETLLTRQTVSSKLSKSFLESY
jgi:pyridoxal/pyridoxine/pyridoxamine kinase